MLRASQRAHGLITRNKRRADAVAFAGVKRLRPKNQIGYKKQNRMGNSLMGQACHTTNAVRIVDQKCDVILVVLRPWIAVSGSIFERQFTPPSPPYRLHAAL